MIFEKGLKNQYEKLHTCLTNVQKEGSAWVDISVDLKKNKNYNKVVAQIK